VSEPEHLKLIIVYDANRNQYSVSAHNVQAEKAEQLVAQWNPHLVSGCSLIMLDQTKRHKTTEGRDCRACRKIVARSANLGPKPKLERKERRNK
jgi:hypothetical protein